MTSTYHATETVNLKLHNGQTAYQPQDKSIRQQVIECPRIPSRKYSRYGVSTLFSCRLGAQLQFTGSSAGVIPREVYASLNAAIMFQMHINQSNIVRTVDYLRFSSSAFQLFHHCYPPTQMLNFLSRQSSCNRSCLTDITILPTVTVPRYFSPCTRYLSRFSLREHLNKLYFPPLFTRSSVQ